MMDVKQAVTAALMKMPELSNLGNMELGGQFLEKLKLFVESADEQFCSSRDAVGDGALVGWG